MKSKKLMVADMHKKLHENYDKMSKKQLDQLSDKLNELLENGNKIIALLKKKKS